LWEKADASDPVCVLVCQFEFGLPIKVPLDDIVITSDTDDVLFHGAKCDIKYVLSVSLEEFGPDFWH